MNGIRARDHERLEVYAPEKRPGFTAWATGFDYGDGRIGLSFKETKLETNTEFVPPLLEMGEAVGAPVSYGSIECGDAEQMSYRVYLVSEDGGRSYTETGRCQLEEGSFCNIGFPDGRIIGLDVPRINEDRTGWCDYIEVRESTDGGTSWTPVTRLLEGNAPYLWRVRRLADGTIVVLACLYGTPWGLGRARATRNTMLPGESYIAKIQTFFLTSVDGRTFTGPHYVLPGIGAHEYEMVEREDGSLLFIAGDVQGTPVARQVVVRDGERFYNQALLPIGLGAPPDAAANPQGGYIPETIVRTRDGLLVGSRRNKPYSVSNDDGENWYPVDGLPPSLYQPYMLTLPDGRIANFGHVGSDSAFGEEDMSIGVDIFEIPNLLPPAARLELVRELDAERTHYLNRYSASLSVAGGPAAGETVVFRFVPTWNPDGTASTLTQDEAPVVIEAVTDSRGIATVDATMFDRIGDIHHYTTVDAVCRPADGPIVRSASMVVASLTPHRRDRHPHAAYFAHGVLHVAPALIESHPGLLETLRALAASDPRVLAEGALPQEVVDAFLECGVLRREDGTLSWLPSVHAPAPLVDAQPQNSGDWYV